MKSKSKLGATKNLKKKAEKLTKKCLICNKDFLVDNWRVGRAKYCSYTCAIKARTSEKSYDKPRVCLGCGNEFLPAAWHQKYCKRECFLSSIRKSRLRVCPACKKEFTQVRLTQKYCSRNCSNPYKGKKTIKKPKHENLDALWSKAVKVLANNKCEYCGKETGLNSHHIFPRSNKKLRWELDNGVCVCVLHHVFGLFSAHKSPIEFVEWLKEYRGQEWYDELRRRAKTTIKITKNDEETIREKLHNAINNAELRKSKNL